MHFIIKQLSRLLAKAVELKGEIVERQAHAKAAQLADQVKQAEARVMELGDLLEKAEWDLWDLRASLREQKLSATAASSVRGHYQDHAATIREFYPAVARKE